MADQNKISSEPSESGRVDGVYQVAEECPLQRVLAVRENGLVLESARAFEVGSAMVLGCHVDRRGAAGGGEFISAEVIVVDSCEIAAGKKCHQVTVLFSEISSGDREILLALPNADGIRLSRSRSGPGVSGAAQRAGLAIPPPEVFPTTQSVAALSATAKYSLMELLADEGKAKQSSNKDAGACGSRAGQSGCSLN